MKRLLVIALTLVLTRALCLNSAFGQTQEEEPVIYNETYPENVYNDLKSAIDGVKNKNGETEVLVINKDIQLPTYFILPNGKKIIIKGKSKDIVIRAANDGNGQYFLKFSGSTQRSEITFENITLDGNRDMRTFKAGTTAKNSPITISGNYNTPFVLKNVVIQNFLVKNDLDALVSVTGDAYFTLDNVKFDNVEFIDNEGKSIKKALVNFDNSMGENTISGIINSSFYLPYTTAYENVSFKCGKLEKESKIEIYGVKFVENATYFIETTLKDVFIIKNPDFGLKLNNAGTGFIIVKASELPKPTEVGIEGKDVGFETLAEAVEAAEEGDRIIVNEAQEISAALNIAKGLTIAGKEDAASTDKIPLDIKGDGKIAVTASTTLSNLKIGKTEEAAEAGSATETSQITVSGEGVVLTLDNIDVADAIAITLTDKGQLAISNGLTVPDGEVIELNIGNHAEGDVLVSGCTEADLAKFRLISDSEDFILKFDSDNGNIILAKEQVEPDPGPDPKPTAIGIEGSEETFDTLAEAIAAALGGAKIVVNESQEISVPVNIEKGLTIAGKRYYAGGVVGTGSTGGSGSGDATEKTALNFVSGGSAGGSTGGSSTAGGSLKVTASATLSNLRIGKAEEAAAPTSSTDASQITIVGEGVVLTLDNIDITSAIAITMTDKGQLKIASGLTVPDEKPIELNIGNHEEGDVLVSGCTENDLAKFKLVSDSENFILKFDSDNGNIILAKEQVEPDPGPEPDPKPTKISILDKEGYDTFEEALEAAVEGDVIIINEPVEILEPVVLNKALTIRGKENLSNCAEPAGEESTNMPSLKITAGYFSFIIGAAVTIENLILDGGGFTGSGLIKISGQSANLKLTDVKINNYGVIEDETAAVIVAGDNGKIAFSGLSTENITLPDGKATLRLSGAGSSIGGKNKLSIQLMEKTAISKSSDLTNTEKITVYPGSHADGDALVSGCAEADLDRFSFVISDELEVKFKDGSIISAKKVKEPEPDPKPAAVSIEGSDETFNTLAEAIAVAESGAKIIVNEPQDINTPLNIDKELTIAGKEDAAAASAEKLALNLKEEGLLKVAASATLSNLKISQTPDNDPAKSGEPAALPSAIGIAVENVCLSLDGIDVAEAMTITLSGKAFVKIAGSLNASEPITLDVREPVEGAVLVAGCVEKDMDKFKFNSGEYVLELKEGNIILVNNKQEPVEPDPKPKPTAIGIDGTDLSFDTLAEAIAASSDGNTIIINENISVSETLVVDKAVTIKGKAGGEITIECGTAPVLRVSSDVALENLGFDGNGASGSCLIDFREGSFGLSLSDVTISNYTFGAGDDRKLVDVSRGCKLHVRNVNVENVNGPANKGMINISGEGSTLDGLTNLSLHLNGTHTVSVKSGGSLAHKTPIRIYTTAHRHGSPVVINCTDPTLFAIVGYELKAEGGNLVLVDLKSGTGVLTSGEEDKTEYFTLDGVKVSKERLVPGVYIRRRGGKTDKIMITL